MVSVGKVMAEYNAANPKPVQICVDSNGIGAGVAHALAQNGVPVQCVNVSESHSSNDRYLRLRDEMWERSREWFYGRDVKIPNDAHFVGEITRIKWAMTPNGKMKAMSKYDAKRTPPVGIGKSPDRSEAFCFTFMGGVSNIIAKQKKQWKYPNFGLA
jgi:glutaredoxin-related protein